MTQLGISEINFLWESDAKKFDCQIYSVTLHGTITKTFPIFIFK